MLDGRALQKGTRRGSRIITICDVKRIISYFYHFRVKSRCLNVLFFYSDEIAPAPLHDYLFVNGASPTTLNFKTFTKIALYHTDLLLQPRRTNALAAVTLLMFFVVFVMTNWHAEFKTFSREPEEVWYATETDVTRWRWRRRRRQLSEQRCAADSSSYNIGGKGKYWYNNIIIIYAVNGGRIDGSADKRKPNHNMVMVSLR